MDMKSKHDAKNATWSQKNRYTKPGITAVIQDEQMNSANAMRHSVVESSGASIFPQQHAAVLYAPRCRGLHGPCEKFGPGP